MKRLSMLPFFRILVLLLAGTPLLAQPVFNILDFGAKPDGKTLCTKAIQAALDSASGRAGKVYIPAGTFLSGTLFISSNTTLELSAGAELKASPKLEDYRKLTWGHHEDRTPWHFLVAQNARNITLTGSGTINGNGPAFWEPNRKHDWAFYKEIEFRPSPMVEITGCENVRIENIRLVNPAGWTLHPFNSRHVKISGITIETHLFGPNCDGIDVGGCQDVTISDCHIRSGDDAIALKTTEDSGPCERVAISNCILETNCVALRIGFESRQDLRDITATNLVVKNCSRVIDIRSVEGAVIERVNIDNVVASTNSGWPVNRVLEINLNPLPDIFGIEIPEHPNYRKPKPLTRKGAIRDISISNLEVLTDGRMMVGAAPGMQIENLRLRNIHLRYALLDACMNLSRKAENNPGFFQGDPELRSAPAALAVHRMKGLVVDHLSVTWPTYPVPDTWNLLKTEWRFLEPDWYKGQEAAIRSGEKRPVFQTFWARESEGLLEGSQTWTDSEGKGNGQDVVGCRWK